ncbi:DUF2515 family protein [Sediminibacillus massiliensis]|uniref:DUF2515 family protein n=1 Tax=Sediminibacillus massiliensis TaxID=1926277 RepID=UPI0009885591|nr:DUF2515 family protein [Sediminibacillus massiliensis]
MQQTRTTLINYIKTVTELANTDNISRTKAYLQFFLAFPEIKWSFLASMVSRNAGWNITDLKTPLFSEFLPEHIRWQLFSTYERANWLIFSDAFPQLVTYQLSKDHKRPLFDLLPSFNVSSYMVSEWMAFWEKGVENRLMNALIINEQNVIQQPVIKNRYYRKHVFFNFPYILQDFLHLNAVLLPTIDGELVGTCVHDFSSLDKRIQLGNKLAFKLFKSGFYEKVIDFAMKTEHTGSRRDYEQFLHGNDGITPGPCLRLVYPVISHRDIIRNDWYLKGGIKKKWLRIKETGDNDVTAESFYRKRALLQSLSKLKREWL